MHEMIKEIVEDDLVRGWWHVLKMDYEIVWCDVQVFIRSKQVVSCIMREWLEDKTKDRLQMGRFFFFSCSCSVDR